MNIEIADRIIELYETQGHADYGECLSERDHALQCAFFAARGGEPGHIIVACLLHDIGHLLHGLGEDIAEQGVDARHEQVGADFLCRFFPEIIVEPIRLHVSAKRYWCWRRPEYVESLSEASKRSLALQGGPMTEAEVAAFEKNRFADAAVWLRRYDEAAKVPDYGVPQFQEYRELLIAYLQQ